MHARLAARLYRGPPSKPPTPHTSPTPQRSSITANVQKIGAPERPAGAGHQNLALRQEFNGPPRNVSRYYEILTDKFSEEEKRQFLLAGERKRRGSHLRHARTDTLGLGLPLAPADYQGTIDRHT